jgi:hypothetical protein
VAGEWNIELLTAAEEGGRNRRTIDAILLAVAVLLAAGAAAVATSSPEDDRQVAAMAQQARLHLAPKSPRRAGCSSRVVRRTRDTARGCRTAARGRLRTPPSHSLGSTWR